jgi:hypothetical protein
MRLSTIANYSRTCRVRLGTGETQMEYRVYAIGTDGHILNSMPLVCDDDDQAKDRAIKLFENNAIELWSGERLVARINSER